MFSNFDFDVIRRSLGYLFFDGMTFTLTLTALSAVGGLMFGTLLALMRLSGLKLLGRIAGLYVDLMRSLPRGQKMAATALGLTTTQAYRYVLLPIAFRVILPPLTSEFLSTIKNTSVAITIGLIELTGQARAMQEFSFQVFEAFTAATVLYLLINIVVVIGMRLLERQVAIPGYISGK